MAKKVLLARRRLPSTSFSSPTHGQGRGGVGGVGPTLVGALHTPQPHPPTDDLAATLFSELQNLEPRQRKQILDRLQLQDLELRDQDKVTRDLGMWAGAVYDALQASIGDGGGGESGVVVLRRLLGARSVWAPVDQLVEAAKVSEEPVVTRQKFYNLLADLLVAHVKRVASYNRVPVGPKLVASNAGKVRELFDAAFPGYLRCGLAKVVLKSHAVG